MKILFTGASSFTGYWFVKELIDAGHEVTCTFTRAQSEYDGIRGERVNELHEICTPLELSSFGDKKFIKEIENNQYDLYCHHMAFISGFNYRSYDYDIAKALEYNINNINNVIEQFKENGGKAILMTGSIFEEGEGAGTKPLEHFYPYAMAKTFAWDVFKYYADHYKLKTGRFVIPNPFGPMEEPKFATYLIKTWYKGEIPEVRTPDYVRDNIHVTLLAKVYRDFAEKLGKSGQDLKINPSQYVGKQEDFAKIFTTEMASRLDIDCPLNFAEQKLFPEPKERYNTDKINAADYDWNAEKAWDQLANFYKEHYS